MTLATVPLNDLSRGTSALRSEIDVAMSRVVSSGWFVLGPEHDALERELAAYVGTSHAINVGNGTDALELALAAVGVTAGDSVVTVANAGAYTTTAVRLLGAFPAYCDVDPQTLLMSVATLEETLAHLPEAPAAIVVTHLYGALAPIEAIVAVAQNRGIPVIEDCAQSLGARTPNGMGGSFADVSTTSFYPTKNLGALGDGGAVFTNNDDIAASVKRMRQYGWESKYNIQYAHGRNSRLDEIQAAILRTKLPLLDAGNARRRDIHALYESATPANAKLVNAAGESFVAHLAVLTSDKRASVRQALGDLGIATDVHYPIPDHQQGFPDFVARAPRLEVTEWASQAIFSVPMFPELTEAETLRVQEALGSI
jgi:aminotransferase EvaB